MDDADDAGGAGAFRARGAVGRKRAKSGWGKVKSSGKPLKKVEKVRTDFRDSWIWSEMLIK